MLWFIQCCVTSHDICSIMMPCLAYNFLGSTYLVLWDMTGGESEDSGSAAACAVDAEGCALDNGTTKVTEARLMSPDC